MKVNPYELEKLAKQHTGEIRATAARATAAQRQAGAARHDQGRSIRYRAGWALIKLGLSVIPTSRGGTGFAEAARP